MSLKTQKPSWSNCPTRTVQLHNRRCVNVQLHGIKGAADIAIGVIPEITSLRGNRMKYTS